MMKQNLSQNTEKLLIDVAITFGESKDLPELLSKICNVNLEFFQERKVSALILSYYDQSKNELTAGIIFSDNEMIDVSQFPAIPLEPPGKGTQSQVIHLNQPIYIPDLDKQLEQNVGQRYTFSDDEGETFLVEGEPENYSEEDHSQSSILAPLRYKGDIIGVLQIQSYRLNGFTRQDLNLLQGLANVTAIALQHVRLIENLEQIVTERTAELKQVNTELAEANSMIKGLLHDTTHELRTPLNSIQGFSEILMTMDVKPERQKKYFNMIHQQAIHMGKLINDLLDSARLEAGYDIALVMESVNIQPIIEELIMKFTEINLHSFIIKADEKDRLVKGDPMRIQQIFQNIYSNAIKYSPNGGEISTTITQENNMLQISIADQGLGIKASNLPHIFDKFYREKDVENTIQGTGLGLYITKMLVELHGGKLKVDSQWGEGSCFTVTLPMEVMSK